VAGIDRKLDSHLRVSPPVWAINRKAEAGIDPIPDVVGPRGGEGGK
jgi:hypothetical protein